MVSRCCATPGEGGTRLGREGVVLLVHQGRQAGTGSLERPLRTAFQLNGVGADHWKLTITAESTQTHTHTDTQTRTHIQTPSRYTHRHTHIRTHTHIQTHARHFQKTSAKCADWARKTFCPFFGLRMPGISIEGIKPMAICSVSHFP